MYLGTPWYIGCVLCPGMKSAHQRRVGPGVLVPTPQEPGAVGKHLQGAAGLATSHAGMHSCSRARAGVCLKALGQCGKPAPVLVWAALEQKPCCCTDAETDLQRG